MRIALIRERKIPADRRVALNPDQCVAVQRAHPGLEIIVESSPDRIFPDRMYQDAGIPVLQDVSSADILMGIKEVPPQFLISDKTYLFFSHTIKKQPHNQQMLRAIAHKGIRLIDYECLDWKDGSRILGFGYWAGVVGVYNGLLSYGKKHNLFTLKPAYECADGEELIANTLAIKPRLPNIKIALTGTGRVASGALAMLHSCGIRQVSVSEYLEHVHDEAVFVNLRNEDLYQLKIEPTAPWDTKHFYQNHHAYEGRFERFIPHTDLLINGFYWESSLPPLFSKADTARNDFKIRVIADVSCDVNGAVPITIRDTHSTDPTFGWDPVQQCEAPPFLSNTIDVMAVSALPSELPADASTDFGKSLMEHIIPLLVNGDQDDILKNATIIQGGHLTDKYHYLTDYVESES